MAIIFDKKKNRYVDAGAGQPATEETLLKLLEANAAQRVISASVTVPKISPQITVNPSALSASIQFPDNYSTDLRGHGTAMASHALSIGLHGTSMSGHANAIADHVTGLGTHSTSVAGHASAIGEHVTGLGVHGNKLATHANGLTEHLTGLTSHVDMMTTHGNKLSTHGADMFSHGEYLGSHGLKMDAHGPKLDGHSEKMDLHGSSLGSHGTALGSHGTVLGSHSTALGTHSTTLGTHKTALDSHTSGLSTHGTVIGNHTSSMGSHITALGTHGTNMSTHASSLSSHVSSLTSHVSALASHVTNLSSHVSALTSHVTSLGTHSSAMNAHSVVIGPGGSMDAKLSLISTNTSKPVNQGNTYASKTSNIFFYFKTDSNGDYMVSAYDSWPSNDSNTTYHSNIVDLAWLLWPTSPGALSQIKVTKVIISAKTNANVGLMLTGGLVKSSAATISVPNATYEHYWQVTGLNTGTSIRRSYFTTPTVMRMSRVNPANIASIQYAQMALPPRIRSGTAFLNTFDGSYPEWPGQGYDIFSTTSNLIGPSTLSREGDIFHFSTSKSDYETFTWTPDQGQPISITSTNYGFAVGAKPTIQIAANTTVTCNASVTIHWVEE